MKVIELIQVTKDLLCEQYSIRYQFVGFYSCAISGYPYSQYFGENIPLEESVENKLLICI